MAKHCLIKSDNNLKKNTEEKCQKYQMHGAGKLDERHTTSTCSCYLTLNPQELLGAATFS